MPLSVLQLAYPVAVMGEDAAGGAEQVLLQLDAALVAGGHRSIVVACEGSRVRGTLVPIARPAGDLEEGREAAQAAVRGVTPELVRRFAIDVVHAHGIDMLAYLPPPPTPVLATLHLPPSWYPPSLFSRRPHVHLQCVSESQRASCPKEARIAAAIGNGIDLETLRPGRTKRSFVLTLGRICPEKGIHHAIDAASHAGVPLVIAGEVQRYAAHERYFETMIAPRLGPGCRFAGKVGVARKRRLLAAARGLLVPSLAPETSSLVAMEALACGTPVVAFANGALPEIVEDGRTGFIVSDAAAMSDAIGRLPMLDRALCRATAVARFDARRMAARYLELYARIAEGASHGG